jgi:hypothetical protein
MFLKLHWRAVPRLATTLDPLIEEHQRSIERFRAHLRVEQGVAHIDLTGELVEGFNKFIPYYLEDGIRYTVVVTRSARRAKVSVGSNPWQRPSPLRNLGEICHRYGGGGHPVVGAVTLPPGQVAEARRIGNEIAKTLREI